MPESLEDFLMTRPPTAERPLLGQTVLVVEDSRFACEALRLICQRSGARIRRADSLRAAHRHLRTYRPGIVLADLGLPDGSGLDLIAELSRAEPRVDVMIGMSGDDSLAGEVMAAGADGFISKPITSIAAFQCAILPLLPEQVRPTGLRVIGTDAVVPDRMALRDDLALAARLLSEGLDDPTLEYVARFVGGLGKSSDDGALVDAARILASRHATGHPVADAVMELRLLLDDRLDKAQSV